MNQGKGLIVNARAKGLVQLICVNSEAGETNAEADEKA